METGRELKNLSQFDALKLLAVSSSTLAEKDLNIPQRESFLELTPKSGKSSAKILIQASEKSLTETSKILEDNSEKAFSYHLTGSQNKSAEEDNPCKKLQTEVCVNQETDIKAEQGLNFMEPIELVEAQKDSLDITRTEKFQTLSPVKTTEEISKNSNTVAEIAIENAQDGCVGENG